MSMTQVAFLNKSELPTVDDIVKSIINRGFDFKILDEISELPKQDGLECSINGFQTFFEMYLEPSEEITVDQKWILPDLQDEDLAISFIWGADFAAGACIGLISIALIELCNAKIYYLDDEMKYTKEMLIQDTPVFLNELTKVKERSKDNFESHQFSVQKKETSTFLKWIKHIFK